MICWFSGANLMYPSFSNGADVCSSLNCIVIFAWVSPWRYAYAALSNRKNQENVCVCDFRTSVPSWYVLLRYCEEKKAWFRNFDVSSLLCCVAGTFASFDYSASTFSCERNGKNISYEFLSRINGHAKIWRGGIRFLSSETHFYGCVSHCCDLTWCQYAVLWQRKCFGSPCRNRSCVDGYSRRFSLPFGSANTENYRTEDKDTQKGRKRFATLQIIWFALLLTLRKILVIFIINDERSILSTKHFLRITTGLSQMHDRFFLSWRKYSEFS